MDTNHKTLISFISPVVGLGLLAFWVYNSNEPFDPIGYLIFGLAVLLIFFGLYFKVKSFKSERLGLTPEDELSKRIKEKAAAKAFNFSIYMWALVILFLTNLEPKLKIIMGLGLMGMILAFFMNWLYFSKVGIRDGDKN